MKKFLVTLLAAATFGGAFAQSSFPDVPENHWAGGAVDRIADLGIVIGFPDGTFRGNEAFTRYQSALVVSRLLDVIGAELDARQALTDADLAALANALQDLAGTVAGHGDAIAAIGDDVAVNTARLDALEAGLPAGVGQDVLNQLEALRVAVDTASAQAEAAHALATNALGAANAAASRAAQNADAIAALSWFANDLEGRVKALEDAPTGDAALAGRVAAAEADIANIREFVILIRREQVAMRGQVAALEGQVDTNTGDIADLQGRVAALEENMITFDGSITVSYRVDRMSGDGNPFDIDRAYGIGQPREMHDTGSTFSSGTAGAPVPAIERLREHRQDIGGFSSPVTAALTLNVSFNRTFDGTGNPNALNDFEAVVDLVLERAQVFDTDYEAGDPITGDDLFEGYVFAVDRFTGTFSPIGDAPLTFAFGRDVPVSFTNYVLNPRASNIRAPGFVATLENPFAFLDFLDPALTFAYIAPDSLDEVIRGARLTLSPFENVTIGASFVQRAENTADQDDLAGDNVQTTVFGVDAAASVGIFELEAEFASSSTGTTDNGNVIYVIAGIDAENIPVLESLEANYRSIPETWAFDEAFNNTRSQYPFEQDQTGFGVNAGLGIWILDLEAYFDSYSTSVDGISSGADAPVTAFGVNLSADLFRAISLYGFFNSVSVDGSAADSTARPYDDADANLTVLDGAVATSVERDDNGYRTGFGVGIEHNGAADDALVAGLNFDVSYGQFEADFGRRIIEANADYELSLGFLSAHPYVGFTSENSGAGAATRPYDQYNVNELRAGLSLETQEFDFYLRPSLVGVFNYRNAVYTEAAGGDYTANELQFSVGLALNEFLFDNSVLTVRYGSWAGTNVNAVLGTTAGANASLIHGGDDNNGVDQFVNGWEAIWNYYDLELAYGVYHSNDGDPVRNSAGQVFSIRYTVDF